jgi:TonB family protein
MLMVPAIALWLALFTPQAATPAPEPPAAQPTQQQSPTPDAPEKAPRPNPNAAGKYHVGDSVTPPRATYEVEPVFPKEAKKRKFSGKTVVNLIVDTKGNPVNVHVQKSIADSMDKKLHDIALSLDQAAVDAVTQYKFVPAMMRGKPVPVELNVEVNFQIF